MPYFVLFYRVVDDFVARRRPFREQHLQKARAAQDRGELLLGGALAEPSERALLAFRADSKQVVEDFAKADPYVVQGLVKKWEVRLWNVVAGTACAPEIPPQERS